MPNPRIVPALLLTALLLTACGADPAASDAAAALDELEEAPTATDQGQTTDDACALLTPDEIAAATGRPPEETVAGGGSCYWTGEVEDPTEIPIEISVDTNYLPDEFATVAQPDDEQVDVGEAAAWDDDLSLLLVDTGAAVFSLQVLSVSGDPKAMAVDLANLIAGRI
ncbi:DUF3558 family protein [Geodermatophilus sp. YIM 151500]|uniref:DUF3558 family protein n=1 Tax=Geodermatophilus sp. YIM 151500 TaxID=2984531 RepID=UPI0021E44171|nr:DUF3558 family protein [Geodermatophilus sp. YIM 151500]MCV2489782.1 DUF3558 family protein [Geodermatophilus sp. YIM 151500]